jgi:hypothetical protein
LNIIRLWIDIRMLQVCLHWRRQRLHSNCAMASYRPWSLYSARLSCFCNQQEVQPSQMDLKLWKKYELRVEIPLLPILLETIWCNLLSHPPPPPSQTLEESMSRRIFKKWDVSFMCYLIGGYRRFGTISFPSSRVKLSKKNEMVKWINVARNRDRQLPGVNRVKLVSIKGGKFLHLLCACFVSNRTVFYKFISTSGIMRWRKSAY